MANEARGQKKNGQTLLGGLDVVVNRNHFGTQIASFECLLDVAELWPKQPTALAIFIR